MVIRSSVQELCDLAPFVAVDPMQPDDFQVLLGCPFVFLDVRVQMVVPTLATLLTNTTWEGLGDVRPVLGSKLFNIFRKFLIFFDGPRTFDHGRIQDFLPTV